MKASYLDGRKIIIDDQVYLYLYGTSYLGLPYNSEFQNLIKEGLNKYGSSLGSSPSSIPQLSVYPELEAFLAARYGVDKAVLFPSGYAAGQAVMGIYQQEGYKITYGNVAHPALKLESKILESQFESTSHASRIHALDFLDPITFEQYNLANVNLEDDVILIDISHGLGLFDDKIKALSNNGKVLMCGSLNKALGINAGVVLCSSNFNNQLRNSLRYKTASAPSPSECYALLKAFDGDLVKNQQNKLKKLVAAFKPNERVRFKDGFPVLKFQDITDPLYDHLKQNEALIWRNNYPTSNSQLVNRAVISAAHKIEDVELIYELLDKFES